MRRGVRRKGKVHVDGVRGCCKRVSQYRSGDTMAGFVGGELFRSMRNTTYILCYISCNREGGRDGGSRMHHGGGHGGKEQWEGGDGRPGQSY